MKDPALLEATASEPLTLEEEYEMQRELIGVGGWLWKVVLQLTRPFRIGSR
jgi:hypothetical protein